MRRKDAADPLEPRFFSFLSWRYSLLESSLDLKFKLSRQRLWSGPVLSLAQTGCRIRCRSCEDFRQEIKEDSKVDQDFRLTTKHRTNPKGDHQANIGMFPMVH